AMGLRSPLRLDRGPKQCRARMGNRPLHQLLHDRVPAVPPRIQAHRAVWVGLSEFDRRNPVPGDVHPGGPPRGSLLGSHVMPPHISGITPRSALACVGVALALGWAVGPGALAVAGADRIRVVTTTGDLKALTQAVGGDLVEVD